MDYTLRRENWNRIGYVSVIRGENGRILAWERWNQSRTTKSVVLRYQARISGQGMRDSKASEITYTKEYKNVNKIVSKRPIKGQTGQIMRVFVARKGRRRLECDGFSYLGDVGNFSRFKAMLMEAERSAWALLPFSPDTWEETLHKRRIIYFLDKKGTPA